MRILPMSPAIPLALAALVLAGCASDPAPGEAEIAAAPAPAPAPAAPSPAAAPTGNGLGLSQERIVALLTERDLVADAFSPQNLDDGREVLTASFPDTTLRQVLWVGIFGGAAEPHTVRLDYFPGNARPEEAAAVAQALDRLMVGLFPDWEDASDWPEVAGARAWEESRRLLSGEAAVQQVPVLQTEQGDVWLEALGVPPDILSYVITTNLACRPSQTDGFYQGYRTCR
jgi:hypothetical protein